MTETRAPSSGPEATRKTSTVRRTMLWLVAFAFLVVVAVGLLELVLRATGYGFDTSFVVQREMRGELYWVPNPSFTWPYFGVRRAREVTPFALPVDKGGESYRIMVVGGSTALGDPDPSYGVARQMEAMLASRLPGARITVVNGGITAANSWVAEDLVRQAGDLEIDLWVVLLGNSEVVGPYGAASRSAALAAHPARVRRATARTGWRLVQLLRQVTGPYGAAAHPDEWIGMESFLERSLPMDDPRLETTYEALTQNLHAIVSAIEERNESVLLCTMPVNLADCAPFASAHSRELDEEELASWQELFDAGVAHQEAGRFAAALASFKGAAAIDEGHAELVYRMATCLRGTGAEATAVGSFSRARDLDVLRFRADSRINTIIREVAEEHAGDHVALADLSREFAAASAGGAAGDGLFYEHIHFNFTGAWLAARTLVGEVLPRLPQALQRHDLASAPLKQEELVNVLAFTEWDRFRVGAELFMRLQQPPFTGQLDNGGDRALAGRWAQSLQRSLRSGGLERSENAYRWALNDRPRDWVLHFNLGQLYLDGIGNSAQAEAEFRFVVEHCPTFAVGYGSLGAALLTQNQAEEAVPQYEKALELRPQSVAVMANLALAKIMLDHKDQAEILFERVLELEPEQEMSRLQLAKLLADRGADRERAQELVQGVLEKYPEHPDALKVLAILNGETGTTEPGAEVEAGAAATESTRGAEETAVEATPIP